MGVILFTYLGLPMGTTKPHLEDLNPLMDGKTVVCLLHLALLLRSSGDDQFCYNTNYNICNVYDQATKRCY